MEQLTEEQQKQVKKMSTARIRQRLIKAGFTELGLEGLSRQELINVLAEDLALESLTFWWKLCEQKRFQIQEMRMVQLKQYLEKIGYREDWIRNQPRVVMMEIVAKAKLAEEEKEEKQKQDEEKRRREEKKEQEEKEEKRRLEKEEKDEKRRLENEEKEEKRRREQEKRRREQEEKEYAARVLE